MTMENTTGYKHQPSLGHDDFHMCWGHFIFLQGGRLPHSKEKRSDKTLTGTEIFIL